MTQPLRNHGRQTDGNRPVALRDLSPRGLATRGPVSTSNTAGQDQVAAMNTVYTRSPLRRSPCDHPHIGICHQPSCWNTRPIKHFENVDGWQRDLTREGIEPNPGMSVVMPAGCGKQKASPRKRFRSPSVEQGVVSLPQTAVPQTPNPTNAYAPTILSDDKLENIRLNTEKWATWHGGPHTLGKDAVLKSRRPNMQMFYFLDHDHGGLAETDHKIGHGHPCEYVKDGAVCGKYLSSP